MKIQTTAGEFAGQFKAGVSQYKLYGVNGISVGPLLIEGVGKDTESFSAIEDIVITVHFGDEMVDLTMDPDVEIELALA